MGKGVEILTERKPPGTAAVRGDTVRFSMRLFLRRGDEVLTDTMQEHPLIKRREVDGSFLLEHELVLGRRRAIAGIEMALAGMTAGAYREVMIPPHLGYGARGIPEQVPPNALLRAQVWLHEIETNGPEGRLDG